MKSDENTMSVLQQMWLNDFRHLIGETQKFRNAVNEHLVKKKAKTILSKQRLLEISKYRWTQ